MKNALTVDLEEWHDTVLFRKKPAGAAGNFLRNVDDILALLERRRVKATFFMLGRLALAYPSAARSIVSAGHELASHGHEHRALWRLTAEEFSADLARSRAALKAAAGTEPAGYRSPTWSLKGRAAEFLPLIRAAGFAYDSSLYGLGPGAARGPYEIIPGLTEFPPSVFRLCGAGFPFLGGTFLRWAGLDFLKARTAGLNSAGLPALLYFHSWEFDPAPPAGLPYYKRAVQYYNVKSVPVKAEALLEAFNWAPVRELLKT